MAVDLAAPFQPFLSQLVRAAEFQLQVGQAADVKKATDENKPAPEDKALRIDAGSAANLAMMWKASGIHPMQALENTHQKQVADAVAAVQTLAAKQAAEAGLLPHFFPLGFGSPGFLPQQPPLAPPHDKTHDERLEAAAKTVRGAQKALVAAVKTYQEAVKNATPLPDLQPLLAHWRTLVDPALVDIRTLLGFFTTPAPQWPDLQTIRDAFTLQKNGIDQAFASHDPAHVRAERIHNACKALVDEVTSPLSTGLEGIASVRMYHMIQPFYLFRLQMSFRASSAKALVEGDQKPPSSALTSLMHQIPADKHPNPVPQDAAWLSDWHIAKLNDLDAALAAIPGGPGHLLFFVKGGRALKFLLGESQVEENDWDTQIVIDPTLKPADWYALFNRVHNLVLTKLGEYKVNLLGELHSHLGTASANVDNHVAKLRRENQTVAAVDRSADGVIRKEERACKAELIDIGIPRYDALEALEQWKSMAPRNGEPAGTRVRKGPVNGKVVAPHPWHRYYVQEYVLMLREVFAETTPAMGKAFKRLTRLQQILAFEGLGAERKPLKTHVEHEAHGVHANVFPECVKLVADETLALVLRRLLIVLLEQFAEAYRFGENPGFAASFDKMFSASWKDRATLAPYPAKFPRLAQANDEQAIADAIGYAHYLSGQMNKHFAVRHTLLVGDKSRPATDQGNKNRKAIMGFVKSMCTAAGLSSDEELQIQFAVSGSFAAYLHADYHKYPGPAKVEPVDMLELKVFRQPGLHGPTIMELVRDMVKNFTKTADQNPLAFALPEPAPKDEEPIMLYWPTVQRIDPFDYKPLAVRIALAPEGQGWPRLDFIWGLPVLSLTDLIREYHQRAAGIEEFGSQQRYRDTLAALTDMLTRFG